MDNRELDFLTLFYARCEEQKDPEFLEAPGRLRDAVPDKVRQAGHSVETAITASTDAIVSEAAALLQNGQLSFRKN